jgi:DNA gyrase/topoisomerase IV subunit B
MSSFRGAGLAREPGIHEHQLEKSRAWPVFMGSGLGLEGRPGTTAEFFRILLGRRGIDVQRYKGLGETNPEQLWETALDPEIRSLLQVKISHADSAGRLDSPAISGGLNYGDAGHALQLP